MNSEFLKTINKIERLKIIKLDFKRLKKEVEEFYTNLIIRNLIIKIEDSKLVDKRVNQAIIGITKARANFEKALSILLTHFSLEDNHYIKTSDNYSQTFQDFNKKIVGISSRLANDYKKIGSQINRKNLNDVSNEGLYIEEFIETLKHFMEDLIIFPLKETYSKFIIKSYRNIEKDGKKSKEELIQDSDLFFWILFNEIYIIARIEGDESRVLFSQDKIGNIKIDESNIYKGYDRVPKNARYKKIEENNEQELNWTMPNNFQENDSMD